MSDDGRYGSGRPAKRDGTLVLSGARLPTLPPVRTAAAAPDTLVLQEGRIAAIGSWRELRDRLPANTAVRDLAGATVLPGLGDAHVHLTATGFLESAIDGSRYRDLAGLLAVVAAQARRTPSGGTVLGLRVEPELYRERRAPTQDELDAAAPDHPVYLRHVTGHASYANGAAMRSLDLHPGRRGVLLNDDGAPTGTLIGATTQEATRRSYAAYSRQVGYESAFRAAAARAARNGCTAVHALDDLDAVRTLLAIEHDLPVRTAAYPQTFDVGAVRALGLSRIGGCHGCALDGDVDMRTAALLAPYPQRPTEYGTLYHNEMSLQGFVLAAHHAGMQLAFHAVGDRAVEQALRLYEAAQAAEFRPNARHRVEHAQLMSDGQRARARAAGVILSLQPAFNHVWDHGSYVASIGPERARRIDPLASAARAGLALAGGSDSTVTELRPLLGVHAAVNHSREEERLGVDQALAMFSSGVAYATHDEARRGRVEVGMAADLTVVDRDPYRVPAHELQALKPLMTVVRGESVFEA